MSIGEFSATFRDGPSRLARLGGDGKSGDDRDAVAILALVEERLSGGPFRREFPGVRFDLPRTVALYRPPSPEEAVRLAEALDPPLRLTGAGAERFITAGDARSRAERLIAAVTAFSSDRFAGEILLLQEIPGLTRHGRHYPVVAGVLLSENHYPVSYMKPSEGVASILFGLSRAGRPPMEAVRFSPAYPELMPDFSLPADIVKNSQRTFLALGAGDDEPREHPLDAGRNDGTLVAVGGIYSRENEMIYPGVFREGIPVVTFAPILRGGLFPLAPILKRLVALLHEIFPRCAATLEFSAIPAAEKRASGVGASFFVERIVASAAPSARPLDVSDLTRLAPRAICTSVSALGGGVVEGVRDVIALCPDTLDLSRSVEIAAEVGEWNDRLSEAGRPYVLVGSGRWGSTDRSLGIPVSWSQVSGTKIQVEAGLDEFNVESSRGTHFFRELTYHEVGALHVSLEKEGDFIDWEYLENFPTAPGATFLRHLSFDEDLSIRIDGAAGNGVILKP